MNVSKISDLKPGQVATIPLTWLDFKDRTFCIRKVFNLESIIGSIQATGQIHPVTVRVTKNGLKIISGWRRCLALRELKAETVQVSVTDKEDVECHFLAASENFDRETVTPAETFRAIERLLEGGAHPKDLMKRFSWGKSYSYAVAKVKEFPQVVQALDEGKFSSFSTAVELAEKLSSEKVLDKRITAHAIERTCDHSWAVKDIGFHLKRELEISQRPSGPPKQQDLYMDNDSEPKGFKSNWKPMWNIEKLQAERERFTEELKKIDHAIRTIKFGGILQKPIKKSV
jgi:ParB/RepB/Spo0J family partition protein